MLIEIDRQDAEDIVEMLIEYRGQVKHGNITGFHQTKEEEIEDVDRKIKIFTDHMR